MPDVSYFVAFGAGLFSFVSPCVLPLVPVYLANVVGATAINDGTIGNRRLMVWHSASFIAGFSVIFIGLGISAGVLGSSLSVAPTEMNKIAGVVIALFGLFLILAYKIPQLNYESRLRPMMGNNPGYLRSFLFGAVFSLGWTPCSGPILGSILTLAWSNQTVWYGASLLSVYSLGLGVPFLVVGFFGTISPLWRGMRRHAGRISMVTGFLLIALGGLMYTGNFIWLNQFLSRFAT